MSTVRLPQFTFAVKARIVADLEGAFSACDFTFPAIRQIRFIIWLAHLIRFVIKSIVRLH